MQWLLVALAQLFATIAAEFAKRGIAKYAFILATIGTWVAMFGTIVASSYITLASLMPSAPNGVAFAVGLLPINTPIYVGAWISTLITKRIYDYYINRSKQLFLV